MRVGLFSGGYFFTAEIAEGYAEENENLEVAKGGSKSNSPSHLGGALRQMSDF